MISRLQGVLIELNGSEVVMDVNGVGYEIACPLSTVFALPALGTSVTLYIHLVVREDAHLLYGFISKKERVLFKTLIKINGVGPKLALSILSAMETDCFVRNIHDQDPAALVKIPGVGKKTAERLIIEMKDKLNQLGDVSQMLQTSITPDMSVSDPEHPLVDAERALLSLGYKPAQATKALDKVAQTGMSSEQLIRAALQAI